MPINKQITYSKFISNLSDSLSEKGFKIDFSGGKVIMDIISDELAKLPDNQVDNFIKEVIWKSRQRNTGK